MFVKVVFPNYTILGKHACQKEYVVDHCNDVAEKSVLSSDPECDELEKEFEH